MRFRRSSVDSVSTVVAIGAHGREWGWGRVYRERSLQQCVWQRGKKKASRVIQSDSPETCVQRGTQIKNSAICYIYPYNGKPTYVMFSFPPWRKLSIRICDKPTHQFHSDTCWVNYDWDEFSLIAGSPVEGGSLVFVCVCVFKPSVTRANGNYVSINALSTLETS